MAMMLRCADSGAKCSFQVTADTFDELMEHVKVHQVHAHPEMKAPPSPEQVRAMIHNA